MTGTVLGQALACARRGWPVFPCQPGQKIPATTHGFRDATTDEQQITAWFTRHPGRNLAIATGTPGPDVLDVDQHGPDGNGFPAYARLRRAGLLAGATAYVRTPSGGLHAYFTGTTQRNGHLPSPSPGLPLPRRLHPRPALPDRRPPLPAPEDHRRPRHPRLARRHPAPATPTAPAAPRAAPGPGPGPGPPGPLGRRPARRQPQRGPVLGRQPRPGDRPGRRPEPPGRRRPPRRPRRDRRSPEPWTPPAEPASPTRILPTTKPRQRTDMSINTPAPASPHGPIPGRRTPVPAPPATTPAACARTAAPTAASRPPPAWPPPRSTTWSPAAAPALPTPPPPCAPSPARPAPRPPGRRRHPAAAAGPCT